MATAADFVSVIPGPNWYIGYCTMASNIYKSGKDIEIIYSSGKEISTNLVKAGYKVVRCKIGSQPEEIEAKQREITEHMTLVSSQLPTAKLGMSQLCRHVVYIAVGYVRAQPILGNIFSIYRCLYT